MQSVKKQKITAVASYQKIFFLHGAVAAGAHHRRDSTIVLFLAFFLLPNSADKPIA